MQRVLLITLGYLIINLSLDFWFNSVKLSITWPFLPKRFFRPWLHSLLNDDIATLRKDTGFFFPFKILITELDTCVIRNSKSRKLFPQACFTHRQFFIQFKWHVLMVSLAQFAIKLKWWARSTREICLLATADPIWIIRVVVRLSTTIIICVHFWQSWIVVMPLRSYFLF